MHASRKILLKHFDARAAEYRDEMASGDCVDDPAQTDKPVRITWKFPIVSPAPEKSNESSGWLAEHSQVEIFRWLYESSVLRQRWTYNEVIGEILLLQFAFIYTTAYVRDSQVHGSGKSM